MGTFHRTNLADEWAFVRGAARIMIAAEDVTFPDEINDLIVTASGVTQYDAQADWTDLGATKTGIQVSVNNAEETFDVDQIIGDIDSAPVNWEASVQTALAEMTLEHLQVTWEGSDIATNTAPTPDERSMGYGQPDNYTRRRLAVLFKNRNNKLRAFVFRKVQLQPVESAVAFNKTGEQISIPVQFKCLADDTIEDVKQRFFMIYEQI
jgi:hypothetical protein